MNSTFKVVFNKARGALMVVNEATSSIQAKGTKTVIASALLSSVLGMVANNAAADEANPTTISKDTLITIADKVPAYNATTVTLENGATLTLQGMTNQHGFFSGESSVVGDGSLILNSTGTGDIGASLGEGRLS